MKKKLLSLLLAAVMTLPMTAFAESMAIEDKGNERAILLCYSGGKLVYSTLLKSENGAFIAEIPDEYADTDKKVYYINTAEFADFDEVETVASDTEVTGTTEPAVTPEPSSTPTPEVTPIPETTAKPTAAPSDTDSPYKKAVDSIYAPALVKDVMRSTNADGAANTSLTVYYQGKEVVVPVEDEITISSAPSICADMKGQTAASLEAGDVIYMAANPSGTKIKTLDLIMRPTYEDIVTSDEDYGSDFETVFTTGNKVAGKWQYENFGDRLSKAKYSYAFGIVAKKTSDTLTLMNKRRRSLYIDLHPNAYVYSCDVSGKDYVFDNGGIYDIETSIPASAFNRDGFALDDSYSYNYALVRLVDGTATDIVVFNNYNY